MMTLGMRARPLRMVPRLDEGEGVSEGARLGMPPPAWDDDGASEESEPGGPGSEENKSGGGRLLPGTVAVMALLGFAAVLGYAYQWGVGDSEMVELPVVQAEPGPEKVKPEDPGGLDVPYRDQLVLNRESGGPEPPRVERLLPPPEVPLLPAPLASASGLSEEAGPPTAAPGELESGAAAGGAGSVASTGGEPPASAGTGAAIETSAGPLPIPPAPPAESREAAPAATKTAAESRPSAPASGAVQTAEKVGGFALQLASLKSSEAAERAWAKLKRDFPNLLGDMSLIVQPADVQGIGKVYRLQTGPFPTRSTAADICAQLKAKRQDCFVVPR